MKYRGVSQATGRLVYGDLFKPGGELKIQLFEWATTTFIIERDQVDFIDCIDSVGNVRAYLKLAPIINDSYSRCAGIEDSNGDELYAGDICNVDGLGVCEVDICEFYGAVFKHDGCEYPVIDSIAENDSFRIIGNIYENKGLLDG